VFLLGLKLVLVPALVVGVSLAGRRWGPQIAGLLASLPIGSGPALLFFAIEQGDPFAAEASRAILITIMAVAAMTVVYAWLSRGLPWSWSLLGACAAFAGTRLLLGGVPWRVLPALGAVIASVIVARVMLPSISGANGSGTRPPWDVALRTVSTVAVVVFVTGLAETLGPNVSGVLAAFPIPLVIVLAFTHAQQGHPAAIRFLRGFIPGMWSAAVFCAVVAMAIEPLGKAGAFLLALGAITIVLVLMWFVVARGDIPDTVRSSLRRFGGNPRPARGPH
jgi:hypothetical protein